MDEQQQKDQFQHWLPFYVNGRLDEAELDWMEEYLANHPSAAADVQIERLLKSALQESLPNFAPDTGLDALMARIQAERQQQRKSKSFFASLVSGLFAEPRWSFAVLAILVQSGVIVALLTNQATLVAPETEDWRSPTGMQQRTGPLLRVTFKTSASEEQIRILLVKLRGTFVCGPGQLGNYIVKVPGNALADAQTLVQASDIVESVDVVQTLPDGC